MRDGRTNNAILLDACVTIREIFSCRFLSPASNPFRDSFGSR